VREFDDAANVQKGESQNGPDQMEKRQRISQGRGADSVPHLPIGLQRRRALFEPQV
jgi:hypothetical protein